MNGIDPIQLRNDMREAIALPPGDPLRQRVVAAVSGAGGALEREWLELVVEDEKLRMAMARVETPNRLGEKLLAIPAESPSPRRAWNWSMAAAIVFLALAVAGGWRAWEWNARNHTLNTLALLSINDHFAETPPAIQTSDPGVFAAAVDPGGVKRTRLPDLGGGFTLLGGGKTHLGPVLSICTRWRGPDGEYTLFQFDPAAFNLPADMEKTLFQPRNPAGGRAPCEILVWIEGGSGFLLAAGLDNCLDELMANHTPAV